MLTGGAGFIGSHVYKNLTSPNNTVVVLDDLSGGRKENLPKDAIFIEGSIDNADLVKSLFEEYCFDYVYHLAAYAAESRSHFLRRFNYQNNIVGSAILINAAVNYGTKCFVFCSSIAVYGEQLPPVTETMLPQPIDPYGIAKYAVELDLQAAKRHFDLDYIIFRPHNVFGPFQNLNDPDRNVIGIFMKQLLSREAITIIGDGEQSRAFSFIDDIAPIIAKSVEISEARNQIFNLGADQHTSINELAKAVAKTMNLEAKTKHLPARLEVQHAYASHKKMHKIFNSIFQSETSLEKGLEIMASWAKTQSTEKQVSSLENEIRLD